MQTTTLDVVVLMLMTVMVFLTIAGGIGLAYRAERRSGDAQDAESAVTEESTVALATAAHH